ncbi:MULTISPECIES: ABC transporter permease [Agrobacterium tumefaciens complex]|jgi:ribose transport system permease protein|uniref:Monosaccharide-transporting ATPase n=1 Tax=Agrobacterium genomosp. 13 str. CFBP 6927 TaxID=1183428 RepID=A0ABP2BL40_9HYPH|nr:MULTISPECIES: ABC transporter permease [Agrobacterium tumefaciens complex]TQN61285.1 ABC transporter permease [Agrobacterium tumefaciens]UXS34726.1 ABC transporter permease [Agrobacterium tumefaciens]CDN95212.1 Permease component of ribose/xylose/arabinose/galactoside ABC-type transporter [Agrobacterium tumefaciens]CUX50827.1 Monosaccharide-transporting ATPase [Agrobacterium genomosp. 13 str. CFBP 6927]
MTITATSERDITVRKISFGMLAQKYSTLVVLVLLFIGFSVATDRFFTSTNLVNILQQISMLTIVAIGLTFGFAAKEMDLSVGYVVGLAGLLCPLLLVAGTPIPLAILAALGAGLAVGLINASLVVGIGVPSLIATLAAGSILWGINFIISGGRAIYGGIPGGYLVLGQGKIGAFFPYPALIMLLLVAFSWFVMERTTFGRYLYAVGGNARAAELSGINVRSYRVYGLALSSFFAAISGIILSARLGSGQPNGGETYLLDGLAAVFIGMTMLRPGTATVMGTFFGALLIGIMNNGLNLMGMDTYIQSIVKGVIIVIAVSIVSRSTKLRLL